MSPPAIICTVIRPRMIIKKLKIIVIRTILTDIGALFISGRILINTLSVHPFIKGSAMIKHTIQNDLHATLMSLRHHLCKKLIAGFEIFLIGHAVNISGCFTILLLIGTQKLSLVMDNFSNMRINVVIILNIIFVIGRRNKQGIKINNINAKILQIIHLIKYTLQITSVKFTDPHAGRMLVPVLYADGFVPDILIFICQDIIRRIAIIEAIHVDLVHYRSLSPFRRLKARNNPEKERFLRVLGNSARIIDTINPSDLHLKIIAVLFLLYLDGTGKIIKLIVPFCNGHQNSLIIVYQKNPVDILRLGTESYLYFRIRIGFCRTDIILCCVTE